MQLQVIINGRAFAGTGAGQFDATVTSDTAALQSKAERPDRRSGESRLQLLGGDRMTLANLPLYDDNNGYLTTWVTQSLKLECLQEQPNDRSTNEPWDAVDFQNLMLWPELFDANNGNGTLGDNAILKSSPSFFGGMRNGTFRGRSLRLAFQETTPCSSGAIVRSITTTTGSTMESGSILDCRFNRLRMASTSSRWCLT